MNFINKHYKLFLLVILILFLFSRLYEFGILPNSVHVDEAGLAYNAFNIAYHNVDRYNNLFPIYVMNFYGGQSPIYTYLVVVLIKLFGLNLFVVRLPALVFSFVTLIFGYLIAKRIFNRSFGVIVAFIITVCPYFIMNSRWALDCNLMLGFFTMSVYFLMMAILNKKNSLYLCSGILFSLTLYTYALSYLIIPVCLLFILIYLIYTKKINFKNFCFFTIPFVLIAIPAILNVLINMGVIGEIHTRFFSIPKMESNRVKEVSLSNISDNLFFLKSYLTDDNIVSNIIPKYGTFYLFSIPFFVVGLFLAIRKLVLSIKNKKIDLFGYICVIFLAFFISLLFVLNANYINKGNALFIVFVLFISLGIYCFSKFFKYSFIVILVYLFAFGNFCFDYFTNYYTDTIEMNYMLALKDADKRGKEIYTINIYSSLTYTNVYAGLALRTPAWQYKENSEYFDKIYFFVPNENNDNMIYIVFENRVDSLLEDDFTCKKFGEIYECYKE